MTCDALSIGQLSRLTRLSAHTLRFYEAEGILMPAGRAASGHRRYRPEDVQWLEFVIRLKLTGMPLADIRQYARLRAEGDSTLQARSALLVRHRENLGARIDELTTCARLLDDKIRTYREWIAEAAAPNPKAHHDPR